MLRLRVDSSAQDATRPAMYPEQLCVVLGQAAVSRLPVPEQVIDYAERVLDFGASARLDLLDLFHHLPQRAVAELFAFARLHRDVPLRALGLLALLDATVAGVSKGVGFLAAKQLAWPPRFPSTGPRFPT